MIILMYQHFERSGHLSVDIKVQRVETLTFHEHSFSLGFNNNIYFKLISLYVSEFNVFLV